MGWVHALAKPGVRARQRIAASDYERRKRLESYEFAYNQALLYMQYKMAYLTL